MSCGPCEEKRNRKKGMTRGAFIGTAAGAAAGAVVGGVGGVAGEDSRSQELCPRPTDDQCDPNGTKTWQIPASVLQVIWAEIFPRFVAYKWRTGAFPGGLAPGIITAADLSSAIKDFLEKTASGLVGTPGEYGSCLVSSGNWTCDILATNPPNPPNRLTPFERRLRVVARYLNNPPVGMIPIRLWGFGGFDFLLSNAGLDLWVPELVGANANIKQAELLRYFEFRRPGRSAIGVPDYLDQADALALDVQSPTGPSQIWIPSSAFGAIPGNPLGPCTLDDLECASWVEWEDEAGADPDVRSEYGVGFEGHRGISATSFSAALAKLRCWQLEGSVYRGILTELPRVIATLWREQAAGCSPPTKSYANRINDPKQMREIFKERLETGLPQPKRMVFRTRANLTDVMISNLGMEFPKPTSPPSFDDMVLSMVEGRAGNPVFTDSRRPLRGP